MGQKLKVASLFTGCGGLDLGLHLAGHEIILQVENDPGAQQVLRAQFPGVRLVNDVCSLESLPKETELLAAGFPCPDVSRLGLRAGLKGSRTGLIRHVFRLLDDRQVPWVLLENVLGLLDRIGGEEPVMKYLVQEFEKRGYRWAYRVLNTAGFGLPQRRRRVFILASKHGDPRDLLLSGRGCFQNLCLQQFGKCCFECFYFPPSSTPDHPLDSNDSDNEESRDNVSPDDSLCNLNLDNEASSEANEKIACVIDLQEYRSPSGSVDVSPTLKCTQHLCALLPSGKFGRLEVEDAERLQGFPEGWTLPCYPVQHPYMPPHTHQRKAVSSSSFQPGGSDRASASAAAAAGMNCHSRWERERWALLGNAVSVPVAKWIGKALATPYTTKYLSSDSNDVKFNLNTTEPWPQKAAWSIGDGHYYSAPHCHEVPQLCRFEPLHPFIKRVGRLPSRDLVRAWVVRSKDMKYKLHPFILRTFEKLGYLDSLEALSFLRFRPGAEVPAPGSPVWARVKLPGADTPCVSAWWPGRVVDADHVILPRGCQGIMPHCLPVVFFGEGTVHQVMMPDDVLPFGDRTTADMESQPSIRHLKYFQSVLQEAKEYYCKLKNQSSEGGESSSHDLVLALPAPPLPSAITTGEESGGEVVSSNQPCKAFSKDYSCGDCQTCTPLLLLTQPQRGAALTDRKPCRFVNISKKAVQGHFGAMLSMLRAKAVGTRIQVFWSEDEKFYPGTVVEFDQNTLKHKILYDDGDEEERRLWTEQVRCTKVPAPKLPELGDGKDGNNSTGSEIVVVPQEDVEDEEVEAPLDPQGVAGKRKRGRPPSGEGKALLLLTAGPSTLPEMNKGIHEGAEQIVDTCSTFPMQKLHSMIKKGKSRFRGVSKSRTKSKEHWCAQVSQNRKKVYLGGCFPSEEEAARAYDAKAKELFGENAMLNFPLSKKARIVGEWKKSPEDLVGSQGDFVWMGDGHPYPGTVLDYNASTGVHQIEFDEDGVKQETDFRTKKHLSQARIAAGIGKCCTLNVSLWPKSHTRPLRSTRGLHSLSLGMTEPETPMSKRTKPLDGILSTPPSESQLISSGPGDDTGNCAVVMAEMDAHSTEPTATTLDFQSHVEN